MRRGKSLQDLYNRLDAICYACSTEEVPGPTVGGPVQAYNRITEEVIEVEDVFLCEIGRNSEGFWTDVTDRLVGQREPMGPFETLQDALLQVNRSVEHLDS